MKKPIKFNKDGDPLSLALLLTISLLFVSVLGVCFSLLISESNDWGNSTAQKPQQKNQDPQVVDEPQKKLQPEDVHVGAVSGVVTSVEENKVTFKTSIYGEEEHEIAIILNEKEQKNIYKYSNTDDVNKKATKTRFSFDDIEAGDFLTFKFPLVVPYKEVHSGTLLIEEIIVDDEFDENVPAE